MWWLEEDSMKEVLDGRDHMGGMGHEGRPLSSS